MTPVPSALLELQGLPRDIKTRPWYDPVPFPEHHQNSEPPPDIMDTEWAEMKQHMDERFRLRLTLLDAIYPFFQSKIRTMDKPRQQMAIEKYPGADGDKSKLMVLHRTGYGKRKSWHDVVESERMLANPYEYMSSLVLGIPSQYTEGTERHVFFFLRYLLFTLQHDASNSASAPELIRLRRDLKRFYKELYDYVISGGPPGVVDDRVLGRALQNFAHVLENTQSLNRAAPYNIEAYNDELGEHNSARFEPVEELQDKMKEDYGDAMGLLSNRGYLKSTAWSKVLEMDDLFGTPA
ncbi:hypothetical protein PG993_010203 [Apiospora rasikravindrae]|uniref:Uncharacterized protein n=1 Tax=Apiospora rasikravindrae TaxID=990691 RepID=A0ABR1SNW7_9PEZI